LIDLTNIIKTTLLDLWKPYQERDIDMLRYCVLRCRMGNSQQQTGASSSSPCRAEHRKAGDASSAVCFLSLP
jgi:hypothetical protein